MISLERERVGICVYLGNEPSVILDAELFELFKHLEIDKSEHLGVIDRAVMVEITETEIFCNGIELVYLKVGIYIP